MHPEQAQLHAELAGRYPPVLTVDDAAVRKGFPLTPLTDLYYLLMRGSWAWLLGLMAAAYLLANIVFAGLYLAGGDCLVGAEPGSFRDAFFFSVQTISTIGYGAVAPKTAYANALVTLEAMIGILGVALATGLTFAKFARPRANLAFSRNLLIAPYDGRRSLYFRVANIRGNDVVEASVRMAVALDVTTTEGHTLRKLFDLKLVRDRSPLFRLSWLVVHVIDEESPIHGLALEDLYRERTMFIITLTGLDGTFAQAVHGRHIYIPNDVVYDHHFVDIIRALGDGRIEFDFDQFHNVEPLTPAQLDKGERDTVDYREAAALDAECKLEIQAEEQGREQSDDA